MIVDVGDGSVRGAVRDGIATWRGIRYARAARFQPPRPAMWTGERDATKFAPVALQSRDPRTAMLSGITDKIEMAEDCQYLNIYSPGVTGKRPVVVWIHGGAFVMGSGSQQLYNGTSFAKQHDLVVVTLNYRLGLLGLLYLGDRLGADYAAGNYALLDQIAALQWVRDHIAAFGGDPARVTIMGESAGAVSVANLLAMPAERGLFHRAILQSGASGLSPPTRADATALTDATCAFLGVTPQQLVELPADRLIAAQEHLSQTRGLGAFTPYVDGVTVPRLPIEGVRQGSAAGVPVLVGTNRDEWALFDLFAPGSTEIVKQQIRGSIGVAAADRLHAAYVAARADRDPVTAWVDVVGDVAFRVPMILLAEAQSRHAPVWMYRFDWASPAFGGKLGAAHALELPFVWNVVDAPVGQMLLGGDPTAQPLATAMHAAWAAFIRGDAPAAPQLPAWPRYDPQRRATLLLDRQSTVADDPAGQLRALWPSS